VDQRTQSGDAMKARFAVFFEFEGDKIRRQRNYDCFDRSERVLT
jgi:hypothetical protein